jgi:beta-mannosidase
MGDHSRLEDDLTPTEFSRIELNTGWEFKQVGAIGVPEPTDEFASVAQFPTNIHLDLELHKRIPDPFMGLNEYKVQWVGEQQWLYKTDFDIQTKPGHLEKLVLQFDGLDTFADVKVNGIPVLAANNMHRTYRVEINDQVQVGTNVLEILFDSAVIKGKQLMDESGFKPGVTPQSTDPSRLLVRKAQYHYGWNWGMFNKHCQAHTSFLLIAYRS